MTITEKIARAKTDYDEVYEAGYAKGQAEGGGDYAQGFEAGKQAEYDRFWDNYQQNGERTNYFGAFSGSAWSKETFKPKYTIRPVDESTNLNLRRGGDMFRAFMRTVKDRADLIRLEDYDIDLSQIITATGMIQSAFLESATLDLSNCIAAPQFCNQSDGGKVYNLTVKVSEKMINNTSATQGNTNYFIYYASELETLTFTEDSVIAFNSPGNSGINLVKSTKLPRESLLTVLRALKDYSQDTSGTDWQLHLGTVNLGKLTDEDKAIATNKGWRLLGD